MNKIYFDNVATTSLNEEVKKTYFDLLNKYYCNSDALYDDGVNVYNLQEKSRSNIANMLDIQPNEIIFTSGASEANNLAIKGLCFKNPDKKHIITSCYEHSSVYNAIKQLETEFGYKVTYLQPKENGLIDSNDIKNSLTNDTILVSIMFVNNEIGVINNINEIKEIVKKNSRAYFHSDITQGFCKLDIDFRDIDLASFSAHKIHGLKGSGALIKKTHVELLPLISGGQQEQGIRGGTSNALVNIVLAKTIRLALENKDKYYDYLRELNDYFTSNISEVDGVIVHTFPNRIKTLYSITTPIPSEVLVNGLNNKGIMVSSKSTCSSKTSKTNRTLSALGIDEDHTIRVSLDFNNTKEEIDIFIIALKELIKNYGQVNL